MTLELVFGQFEFLEDSRVVLPSRRTSYLKKKIGCDRPMKGRLAIDGRDHASFDQNGAIKSHTFDQKWKIKMRPRCAF